VGPTFSQHGFRLFSEWTDLGNCEPRKSLPGRLCKNRAVRVDPKRNAAALTCRRCGGYRGTTVVAITYVPAGRSGYLKKPNQSQRFQLSPQSKDPNGVVGSQSRSSGAFPLSSSRSTRMPLRTSVTFTYMISYRMDAGQTGGGGGGAIGESSVPLHDGRLVGDIRNIRKQQKTGFYSPHAI
jgi:hypothetical protein